MPDFLTSDGVTIEYEVDDFRDPWLTEEPETVLFHHGFARSMKWWQQWVPAVARHYRVVRFDVRGCGRSSVPPRDGDWSAARLLQDALQLIDTLAIDKVHWVGHASGGLLGELFAINCPDRIRSLTLVSGPPVLEPELLTMYAMDEEDSLISMERYGLKEWLRRTNMARFDLSRGETEVVKWHTEEQAKTAFHAAYRLHETFRGGDARRNLADIAVPTLLIAPDHSPVTPLPQQRKMAETIPNARLVVMPALGSEVVLIMAEQCVEETLRFLRSIR